MEVINLSSRSFKGLRTLELPNTVYNTEGKIYICLLYTSDAADEL